jgi:hypothetical protein
MDVAKVLSFVGILRITPDIKKQLTAEELALLVAKRQLQRIKRRNQIKYTENINGYKYKRLLTFYNNKWKDNEDYNKILNNTELTPEQRYFDIKIWNSQMNANKFMIENKITNTRIISNKI